MLDGILKKLFGDKNQKDLNELAPIVDSTNEQYVKLRDISDDQLREKTAEFKQAIEKACNEIRDKKTRS
jgi:preprotein translocase subunit SecA